MIEKDLGSVKTGKEETIALLETFKTRIERRLVESCPHATGNLANSIEVKVEPLDKGYKIIVYMDNYGKYVEYGNPMTLGTVKAGTPMTENKPSLEDIESWCKTKGINEKFAFPIWKSITQTGTRPQPFIRNYFNNKIEEDFREIFG